MDDDYNLQPWELVAVSPRNWPIAKLKGYMQKYSEFAPVAPTGNNKADWVASFQIFQGEIEKSRISPPKTRDKSPLRHHQKKRPQRRKQQQQQLVPPCEPKHIAVYLDKGGVGKTTTSFHLAHMLAHQGKRVLLVDCDPQCNLTQLVLQSEVEANWEGDYEAYINQPVEAIAPDTPRTLYDSISVVRSVNPQPPSPAHSISVGERLWLLPGHADFSDFDGFISSAESTIRAFPQVNYLLIALLKIELF